MNEQTEIQTTWIYLFTLTPLNQTKPNGKNKKNKKENQTLFTYVQKDQNKKNNQVKSNFQCNQPYKLKPINTCTSQIKNKNGKQKNSKTKLSRSIPNKCKIRNLLFTGNLTRNDFSNKTSIGS